MATLERDSGRIRCSTSTDRAYDVDDPMSERMVASRRHDFQGRESIESGGPFCRGLGGVTKRGSADAGRRPLARRSWLALGSAKGLACWRTVARFVLALCRTGADRARGGSRQGVWVDVHGQVHWGRLKQGDAHGGSGIDGSIEGRAGETAGGLITRVPPLETGDKNPAVRAWLEPLARSQRAALTYAIPWLARLVLANAASYLAIICA